MEEDLKQQVEHLQTQLTLLQEEFDKLRKSDRYTFKKDLEIENGRNILLDTDTGTKIGTATDQKLAFYGEAPILQSTVANTPRTAFVENSDTAVNIDSTFGGWTIQEVVQALINVGILDGTVS